MKARFHIPKNGLLLIVLGALAAAALIDFFALGLARRTFVFYAIDSGIATVEERLLRTSRGSRTSTEDQSIVREIDISRYVEEALLGPVSPNALPLFPKETRLQSLLYRNGVVYVNLSEDAALPPVESIPALGGDVFIGMETLYSGIKRNFPFVKEVRFFIAGEAAYAGKFR